MKKSDLKLQGPQNQHLGNVLRKVRESLGKTQPAFAVENGIAVGSLQRWEQGKGLPRLDTAVRLLRCLGYQGLRELGYDVDSIVGALKAPGPAGSGERPHVTKHKEKRQKVVSTKV
jgi:transcriptional regulator with XRE-family HTH domain